MGKTLVGQREKQLASLLDQDPQGGRHSICPRYRPVKMTKIGIEMGGFLEASCVSWQGKDAARVGQGTLPGKPGQ